MSKMTRFFKRTPRGMFNFLGNELTEECFRSNPVQFAGDSKLMMANGTMLPLVSTFVESWAHGTASTWQMLPIPMSHDYCTPGAASAPNCDAHGNAPGLPFPSQCGDSCPEGGCPGLSQLQCSGEWITNITLYDQLQVPEGLQPGAWVLSFRWDCESSAQVVRFIR